MSDFILRYYYILDDEINIDSIAKKNNLEIIEHTQPDFSKLIDFIYIFQQKIEDIKILAIKILVTDDVMENAWERLIKIENELNFFAIEGKLTLFVISSGDIKKRLKIDPVLSLFSYNEIDEIGDTPLILLLWSKKTGSLYLCYDLSGTKLMALHMLFNKIPLMYGRIIQLHKLLRYLNKKNSNIQKQKIVMECRLINILHSKLASKTCAKDTEELENDIEWLASSYAKLVTNQNINMDSLNLLKSSINNVERNIKRDLSLIKNIKIYYRLTENLREGLLDLERTNEELNLLREEIKAAIDIVQSRIQVINERTDIIIQDKIKELLLVNINIQKQSIIYQYAAGLIEFIVLAYYSHTLWSHLAHTAYEIIPSWLQFIVVILFSANTVLLTHAISEYSQGEKHIFKRMIIFLITLFLMFIIIVLGTWYVSKIFNVMSIVSGMPKLLDY